MKPTAILQRIHPFLTVSLLLIFAGCGGGGGDGGSGACPPGVTCNGAGGGGGGGGGNSQVPTISIAPGDTQNVLTLTPPTGSTATTFNIYWSTSPIVSTATATKFTDVPTGFTHTGLTNGNPIFYVATAVVGGTESTPSAVVGGMPGKWTPLTPPNPPTARDSHTAVYNATSRRMIVFGGRDENTALKDLWILQNADTVSPTWSSPPAIINQPSLGLVGHTAVYDDQNNMTVFGGSTDAFGTTGALTNDLRKLSKADDSSGTPQWAAIPISGPGKRWGHAAVYDSTRDQMIVFGGSTQTSGTLSKEVWVLHNVKTAPSWEQIQPPGGPSERCCMAVGYDPANQRMIVFGGFGGFGQSGGNLLGDVWTLTFNDISFTTATWQELTASGGPAPAARCCSASLWDGSKLLLFGGGSLQTTGSATPTPPSDNKIYALALQATTFTSAVGPAGPAARLFPTAVPAGPFLLFGGSGAAGPLNDLWRFD